MPGFRKKIAPDDDVEDGCHPEEAQALKDYLRQKTTAIEAAQAIAQPIMIAKTPKDDRARLWGLLMDALLELPKQHTEALLTLLQAIENLPDPESTTLAGEQPINGFWRGLPGFGHLWSDMYKSGNWRSMVGAYSSPGRNATRDEYSRQAEIEARLVAADIASIPLDWGYETVADALECRTAMLDIEVPAAAEWLVHCGERFRLGAVNGETSWALKPHCADSRTAVLRDLWTSSLDREMSLERWVFWNERLGALHAESVELEGAAEKALHAMWEADEKIIQAGGTDHVS